MVDEAHYEGCNAFRFESILMHNVVGEIKDGQVTSLIKARDSKIHKPDTILI